MSSMPPINPAADRGRLAPVRGDAPSAVREPPNARGIRAEFVTSAIPRKVPSVQEAASVARAQVEAAAQKIQNFANSLGKGINFVVDSSSGKAVIRVTDPSTNETVRQIPPEESLRIAKVVDYLASLLVSQRA
ncbi:MAG: flagellar protein FlaG [Burkholderiaceae bacterium]|jgi:flagellar protein FlaG|nr:flagellar protein FlaG [Burkholderiaceae bacterium]